MTKIYGFFRLGVAAGLPPPGITLKHLWRMALGALRVKPTQDTNCVAARDFAKNAATRRPNWARNRDFSENHFFWKMVVLTPPLSARQLFTQAAD